MEDILNIFESAETCGDNMHYIRAMQCSNMHLKIWLQTICDSIHDKNTWLVPKVREWESCIVLLNWDLSLEGIML